MPTTPITTAAAAVAEKPELAIAGAAHPLRFDLAALYRLQEAGLSASLERLTTAESGVKAAIDLLWAALPEAAHAALESDRPTALAGLLAGQGYDVSRIIALVAAMLGAEDSPAKKAKPSS